MSFLVRQMVRKVLLEGPLEKMQNMGVPEPIAKYLYRKIMAWSPAGEGGCGDHAHWFAVQLKGTMHQWDEEVGVWKEEAKNKKRIAKKVKKTSGPPQFDQKSKKPIITMDRAGIPPVDHELRQHYELVLAKIKHSENRLKKVIQDMQPVIEIICQWATETGVNLSKKKTADIPTGKQDDKGREIYKKVPFDLGVAEQLATRHLGIQEGKKFMEFDDGWYWLNRETNVCSIEARLMQHCGRTDHSDSNIWSLRDKDGMPHITTEIRDTDEGRVVYQMKGKQNATPDEKYWPRIFALLTNPQLKLKGYAARGRYGGDLEWHHIPEDVQAKIQEANPDFEADTRSVEEIAGDTIEERDREFASEMGEAETEVNLQYVDVEWQLSEDSGGMEEDDASDYYPYGYWSGDINLGIEVPVRFNSSDLEGYLKSIINTENFELDIYGWSAGSLRLKITDDDGSSGSAYEYKDYLTWAKETFDDHYDLIQKSIAEWLVFNGYDEPGEQVEDKYSDIFLRARNLIDDDGYVRGNLTHGMIRLIFSFKQKTDGPLEVPDDKSMEVSLALKRIVSHDTRFSQEDIKSISATSNGGILNVIMDFGLYTDNDSEELENLDKIRFVEWINENYDLVKTTIFDYINQFLTNPFELDKHVGNITRLKKAFKYHGVDLGEHVQLANPQYGGKETRLVMFGGVPTNLLVQVLYGEEEAKKHDFWQDRHIMSQDPDVIFPPAKTYTIGKWIKILKDFMNEYQSLLKAAKEKAGTTRDGWYGVNDMKDYLKLLEKPIQGTLGPDGSPQEEALRRLVRKSLRTSLDDH